MPAKWQQWMPFRIDAFKGSPAVQAMHPSARAGYIYLLSCAWQTEDCTISSDPLDLAENSGLGDELWAIHAPRILRKFDLVDDGRLRNAACYEEWQEAKRVFDRKHVDPEEVSRKRSEAGRKGNQTRWGDSQKDRNSDINDSQAYRKVSQTGTGTGTGTGTEEQVQKQTAAKKPPRAMILRSDGRRSLFKGRLEDYWKQVNPQGPTMTWAPPEDVELEKLLLHNLNLTVEAFGNLLDNRARSLDGSQSELIRVWLVSVIRYKTPLNQYGRPFDPDKPTGENHAAAPLSKAERTMAVLAESLGRGQHKNPDRQNGDLSSSGAGQTEPRTLHGNDPPPGPARLPSGDGDSGGKPEGGRADRAPIPW